MAKYTATQSKNTYASFELAVAGLETLLEAIDTGKNNLEYGIEKLDGGRWGAWVVYTAEA
jgi:exonuclease VII small subunit